MLTESLSRLRCLPYQRKKLPKCNGLLCPGLRERGSQVDYRVAQNFQEGVKQHLDTYTPDGLICMVASEYRGRRSGENACLFNYLYWKFLLEHEGTLRANPHMGAKVLALRYVDVDERIWIQIQMRSSPG